MFQKKTLIVCFVVVALGLVFGTFFIRSNHKQDTKKAEASSATNTITTQADWVAGANVNTDLNTSPGSVKIGDTNFGVVTATGAGDDSYNGIYSANGVNDGKPAYINGAGRWLCWDTGTIRWTITAIECQSPDIVYTQGYVGNQYDNLPANSWRPGNIGPATAPGPTLAVSATASHLTSPTQIDGGANFWHWDSFTDSKVIPQYTSVTYRYRSSTNGSDWTIWVGSLGAVTSRTGDDSNNPIKYRYLQVEATLSNTDGTSTPTIDSYSIGYHTNQKPNAPTAMTAVIN